MACGRPSVYFACRPVDCAQTHDSPWISDVDSGCRLSSLSSFFPTRRGLKGFPSPYAGLCWHGLLKPYLAPLRPLALDLWRSWSADLDTEGLLYSAVRTVFDLYVSSPHALTILAQKEDLTIIRPGTHPTDTWSNIRNAAPHLAEKKRYYSIIGM